MLQHTSPRPVARPYPTQHPHSTSKTILNTHYSTKGEAFASTPPTTETDYQPEPDSTSPLSGRVLVLNQSYEPMSVCNVQKAMVLLFLNKADLVASDEVRVIRSVSQHFAYPSVIRLRRYINVPIKRVELSRKNILRRDGNRCQYCGTLKGQLTVDHVTPKSRGGGDTWENLVCACVRCNVKKGNRTPDEAGLSLLKTPRRPSHVTFIRSIGGEIDEHWKPYLFMS
jgi:5-methylcytosine-specific restriction endonuclease McrA